MRLGKRRGLRHSSIGHNRASHALTVASSALWTHPENSTALIGRVPARGGTGAKTYTKSGGDHASFTLDSATGEFNLTSGGDIETKATYTFTANVADSLTNEDVTITINLEGADEFVPSFTSPSAVTIPTGTSFVLDITLSDSDVGEADATWSIIGGADEDLFVFAPSHVPWEPDVSPPNTSTLEFIEPPTVADDYVVEVQAVKADRTITQTITVTVATTAAPTIDVSQPDIADIHTLHPVGHPVGPIACTGTVQSAISNDSDFYITMQGGVPWLHIGSNSLTAGAKTVSVTIYGEGEQGEDTDDISVTVAAAIATPTVAIVVTNANVEPDVAAATKLADITLTNADPVASITLTIDAESASGAWELVEISELVFELRVDTAATFAALAGSVAIIHITADNTNGYPGHTAQGTIQFAINAAAAGGFTLGTEWWPQPAFAASTNLYIDSNWTITGGVADSDGTSGEMSGLGETVSPLTLGSGDYQVDFDITESTSGSVTLTDGGQQIATAVSSVATHSYVVSPASQLFVPGDNFGSFAGDITHYSGLTLVEHASEVDIFGKLWEDYIPGAVSGNKYSYEVDLTTLTGGSVTSGDYFVCHIVKPGASDKWYINTDGNHLKMTLSGSDATVTQGSATDNGGRLLADGSYLCWQLRSTWDGTGTFYPHCLNNSGTLNYTGDGSTVYFRLGTFWLEPTNGNDEPQICGPRIIFESASFDGKIDNVTIKPITAGDSAEEWPQNDNYAGAETITTTSGAGKWTITDHELEFLNSSAANVGGHGAMWTTSPDGATDYDIKFEVYDYTGTDGKLYYGWDGESPDSGEGDGRLIQHTGNNAIITDVITPRSGAADLLFYAYTGATFKIRGITVKEVVSGGGGGGPLNALPTGATEVDVTTGVTHYNVVAPVADTGTDYTGLTFRRYDEDNATGYHYSSVPAPDLSLGSDTEYFLVAVVKPDENAKFALNTSATPQHNWDLTGNGSNITAWASQGFKKLADGSFMVWIKFNYWATVTSKKLYYQFLQDSDNAGQYTGTTGDGVQLGRMYLEPSNGRNEPTDIGGAAEAANTPVLTATLTSSNHREDAALNTVLWNCSALFPNSIDSGHDYTVADVTGAAFSTGAVAINATTGQGTIASESDWAALVGTTITLAITADNDEGTPSTDTKNVSIQITAIPSTDPDYGPQLWADHSAYVGTGSVNSLTNGWAADALIDNQYTKADGTTGGNIGMTGANAPMVVGRTYKHRMTLVEQTSAVGVGSLHFGWTYLSGAWSANHVDKEPGVYEVELVAQHERLYIWAGTGWTGTIADISCEEVIGAGGGGTDTGGTGGGTEGGGAGVTGDANFLELQSRLDAHALNRNYQATDGSFYTSKYWPHPLGGWHQAPHGPRLTVADGYNRAGAFWGLNYAYRLTKDNRYLERAWLLAEEYIDDGALDTNDSYKDYPSSSAPGWSPFVDYNPAQNKYGGVSFNHDHYSWRAASGIGMTLTTMLDNTSATASTSGRRQKAAEWLRDHIWLKWQVYSIEAPDRQNESNIPNTTGTEGVTRTAMFAIALDKYYGGTEYLNWINSRVGYVRNMINQNTVNGVMQYLYRHHTQTNTVVEDLSHAGDSAIGIREVYEQGYTTAMPLATVTAAARGLNEVIWKGNGFAAWTDGSGPVNDSYYGNNLGGWFALIKYAPENAQAYINWALNISPTVGSSSLSDKKDAMHGVLLEYAVIGTTYFVTETGSDSNDGRTEANGWATFAHAKTVATQPGDKVYVKAGTYSEKLWVDHANGTADAPISFIGYQSVPGDNPFYSVKTPGTNGIDSRVPSAATIRFKYDTTVDDTLMPVIDLGDRTAGTGIYVRKNYIRIENFTVINCLTGLATEETGKGDNCTFVNINTMDHGDLTAAYSGQGITIATSNCLIEDCSTNDMGGQGLTVMGYYESGVGNNTFNRCVCTASTNSDSNGCDYYAVVRDSSDNTFNDCYIERVGSPSHVGHGWTVKAENYVATNNIFNRCVAVDMEGTGMKCWYEYAQGNSFEGGVIIDGDAIGSVNGSQNNSWNNITVYDSRYLFVIQSESSWYANPGHWASKGNTFQNITATGITSDAFHFGGYGSNTNKSAAATTETTTFNNVDVTAAGAGLYLARIEHVVEASTQFNGVTIRDYDNKYYGDKESAFAGVYSNATLVNCGFTLSGSTSTSGSIVTPAGNITPLAIEDQTYAAAFESSVTANDSSIQYTLSNSSDGHTTPYVASYLLIAAFGKFLSSGSTADAARLLTWSQTVISAATTTSTAEPGYLSWAPTSGYPGQVTASGEYAAYWLTETQGAAALAPIAYLMSLQTSILSTGEIAQWRDILAWVRTHIIDKWILRVNEAWWDTYAAIAGTYGAGGKEKSIFVGLLNRACSLDIANATQSGWADTVRTGMLAEMENSTTQYSVVPESGSRRYRWDTDTSHGHRAPLWMFLEWMMTGDATVRSELVGSAKHFRSMVWDKSIVTMAHSSRYYGGASYGAVSSNPWNGFPQLGAVDASMQTWLDAAAANPAGVPRSTHAAAPLQYYAWQMASRAIRNSGL